MDPNLRSEITKNPLEARRFAFEFEKEGKYQDALEMYEWLYFNGFSDTPELSGIRFTLALIHWKNLADDYPLAKTRLNEIKQESINKIKKGSWRLENFSDVMAISRILEDNSTIIEIFKEIDKQDQDINKVEECFNLIFDLLAESNEEELCQKYTLREPAKIVNQYKEILNKAKKNYSLVHVKGADYSEHVQVFIENMKRLVKALKFANREEEILAVYKAGRGVISDSEYQKIFE